MSPVRDDPSSDQIKFFDRVYTQTKGLVVYQRKRTRLAEVLAKRERFLSREKFEVINQPS